MDYYNEVLKRSGSDSDKLVDPKLHKLATAVDQFLKEQSKSKSPVTFRRYRFTLLQFIEKYKIRSIAEISDDLVKEYTNERGYMHSTLAGRASVQNSFDYWLIGFILNSTD